jgi:two-component system chemotaxis response regulator CheB
VERIKVLVVDDSAIVREILKTRLSADPRLQVVATAPDPYVARTKIESLAVDVVTLDLEMPRMDGLTFLRHLMRDYPLPVVVVSSLASDHTVALSCLEAGAVELVAKPGGPMSVSTMVHELIEKIVASAQVDERHLNTPTAPPRVANVLTRTTTTKHLVVVGASTGGTQALEVLFRGFPVGFPPVVAVIHMPQGFTKSFAQRLDSLVPMAVKEAEDKEKVLPGTIYIAPGNFHVLVKAVGADRVLHLSSGPRVFNQRPAVDVLFQSAAEALGRNVTGVLLTGMGKDGAQGLKDIRDAGGPTAAQDEATSVVFGMPKEASALGAAQAVLPLGDIAGWVGETLP